MIERFLEGGIIMWPMLLVAIWIAVLAVRTASTLRGSPNPTADGRRQLNSILLWGGIGLLLGALGTVVGLVVMADAVQRAGGVSAGLLWGGVSVSLVSLAFGLIIFLFAGGLWLALDRWGLHSAGRVGAEGSA